MWMGERCPGLISEQCCSQLEDDWVPRERCILNLLAADGNTLLGSRVGRSAYRRLPSSYKVIGGYDMGGFRLPGAAGMGGEGALLRSPQCSADAPRYGAWHAEAGGEPAAQRQRLAEGRLMELAEL